MPPKKKPILTDETVKKLTAPSKGRKPKNKK
jgi:hypothetical protein